MSTGKTSVLYRPSPDQTRLCGVGKDGAVGFAAEGVKLIRRHMSADEARRLLALCVPHWLHLCDNSDGYYGQAELTNADGARCASK